MVISFVIDLRLTKLKHAINQFNIACRGIDHSRNI
jgi:hypothetical protein